MRQKNYSGICSRPFDDRQLQQFKDNVTIMISFFKKNQTHKSIHATYRDEDVCINT